MSRAVAALWLLAFTLVVLAGAALARPAGAATGFQIIVHPDNPAQRVSHRFVADAFLKRTVRWPHGELLAPVDLTPKSGLRAEFSEQVLGKPLTALRMHWQQIIFTGRGLPPPELGTEAAVVQYVLRERGALGYVSQGSACAPAKVVTLH
jgi:ABC-type phosphate transport system substrate-binding protein